MMEEIHFSTFSLPSHDIHGNWQNLLSNNLEYIDGEYLPKPEWEMPRPQPLFAICVLSAQTDKLYFKEAMPKCSDREEVEKILDDIYLRALITDELHEQFLQNDSNST